MPVNRPGGQDVTRPADAASSRECIRPETRGLPDGGGDDDSMAESWFFMGTSAFQALNSPSGGRRREEKGKSFRSGSAP